MWKFVQVLWKFTWSTESKVPQILCVCVGGGGVKRVCVCAQVHGNYASCVCTYVMQ